MNFDHYTNFRNIQYKNTFLNKFFYTTHFISSARSGAAEWPPQKKSFEPRNLNIMKFVLNISKPADAAPLSLSRNARIPKRCLNTSQITARATFCPRSGRRA